MGVVVTLLGAALYKAVGIGYLVSRTSDRAVIFIFFSGLSAAQKTDAHVRRGNASLRREGHSFSHRDMMSTALDVGEVPIGSGSMSQ